MFLSRRAGVYYLFFFDELGKCHKVSTGSKVKSEALKFLQTFKQEQKTAKSSPTLLSRFTDDYLAYSRAVHRPKSTESAGTALRELRKVLDDRVMQTIGIREVEKFVGVKQREASARTARVYLVTLASAFETAKRWGLVQTNPFRSVEKPRLPETTPSYLTPEQFQTLIASVENETLRSLHLCAAMTGLRLSELTALRWEVINDNYNSPSNELPHEFALAQNYPNPFNPTTTIQFTIVNRQSPIVRVYDILGGDIATLLNEVKEPRPYTVQWDASGVSSSVYFYRLRAGDFVQSGRMLLLH